VVNALSASPDFVVVDFEPFKSKDAWSIIVSSVELQLTKCADTSQSKLYYTGDGGARLYEQCKASGEPVLPLTKWILEEAGYGGKPAPVPELLRVSEESDSGRWHL
jgi:hypothetical protein